MTVLLVGVSTRAAAESAARAGFAVTALDAFADIDQHPAVEAVRVPGRFSARAVERAARRVDADAVAYLSPFENHPAVVARLASGRVLLGNPPDVLRRARNPRAVARAVADAGFALPAGDRRVVKPLRSGGGKGVRLLAPGGRIPPGSYAQPFVEGECWSVSFAATGGRVAVLGFSKQLVGEAAFGANGFRYCGSLLVTPDPRLRDRSAALAGGLARAFGLRGVNGIDFIRRDDEPVAIEVNPRWCSSMELLDRAGIAMFGVHADACRGGLPAAAPGPVAGVHGKAIVFAREAVTIGDIAPWRAAADVRDVPPAGQRVTAGSPVCTVFASAADEGRCREALVAAANRIYQQLGRWRRRVA